MGGTWRQQLERHKYSLQSLAAFALSLVALRYASPARFAFLTNPLALGPALYAAGWVVKNASLSAIDHLVMACLERRYGDRKMPYRPNTGAVGLKYLEAIDYAFLAMNSVIEFIFACHVAHLVITSPHMAWHPRELGVLNTVPALYLVFAVDDAFYAPTHLLMHRGWFYPYVHKHHHRQNLPERGYLDAGNEHPIEQVLGLSCLYVTLIIVAYITRVHALTILVHFLLYAVLALLNHTAFDVRFEFCGFEYTVRAHEMHHRYPTKNMAQYFMFWDKLYGTYKPYYDGADKAKKREKLAAEASERTVLKTGEHLAKEKVR